MIFRLSSAEYMESGNYVKQIVSKQILIIFIMPSSQHLHVLLYTTHWTLHTAH